MAQFHKLAPLDLSNITCLLQTTLAKLSPNIGSTEIKLKALHILSRTLYMEYHLSGDPLILTEAFSNIHSAVEICGTQHQSLKGDSQEVLEAGMYIMSIEALLHNRQDNLAENLRSRTEKPIPKTLKIFPPSIWVAK